MEHILENDLNEIVAKIASISDNAFFGLHHALAYTILPNGENAHCTVKPAIWYYELFKRHYNTPYPLKGRMPELSAIITFTPSIDFLRKYEQIVAPKPQQIIIENSKVFPYKIGKFISLFIPKKKNRKHFRERYVMNK